MSDAPRQQAPDDRADDQQPAAAGPPDGSEAHDALGAWPGPDEEAGAMPAEHAPGEHAPADGADDAAAQRDGAAREKAAEDPRSREELLEALHAAEAARDEYLDDVRRARAEFENFRRRTMREGASQREAGKAEVLGGMLEVLDDVDRTLEAATASQDEHLAKGVEMVVEKLVRSLQAAGLERVDATGEPFDPNQHEAVQQVEGDGSHQEPVVAQVLRPGYRLGERVLRAAMVVVEQ